MPGTVQNLVQRIWGVFSPVSGGLLGVTTSGEFPYYPINGSSQNFPSVAATGGARLVPSGVVTQVTAGSYKVAGDQGGGVYVAAPASTSGCYFLGSVSGTALTVATVFNGALAVGLSVNAPDGSTIGTIVSGAGSSWVLSAAGSVSGNQNLSADDGGYSYLVGLDGGRWKLTAGGGGPAPVEITAGVTASITNFLRPVGDPFRYGATGAGGAADSTALATSRTIWAQQSFQALVQADVGQRLYKQTAAEASAGVTPVNYFQPPGAIERYYSGSGDARTAIQNALNCNVEVYSVSRWQTQFPVSNYLLVPPNVRLRDCAILGTNGVTNYAPWGAGHQGQSVLLNGAQAKCTGVWIAGGGNNFGGVGALNAEGTQIIGCFIENTGTAQPILAQCSNTVIYNNYIRHSFTNAVQIYGSNAVIGGNIIRCVNGGGIFCGFGATNITIAGNFLSDIGDVGLDLEGGTNISVVGNVITRCVTGELTWFTGASTPGINCTFKSNTALRVATWTSWSGDTEISSLPISGISQAASAIVTSSSTDALNPFTGVKNLSFSGISGMTQMNGLTGVVASIGGVQGNWTAVVSINSTGFTAYTSGGTATLATTVNSGAIFLASIQTGQSDIVFEDNTIRAIGRAAIFSSQLESGAPFDCGIVIQGGTVTSDTLLLSINSAPGIVIRDVAFKGLSGAETGNNLVKNIYGGRIERCTFDYATAPSGANYALDYFTDGAVSAGGQPVISGNLFYGTGDNAFNHRPGSVPAVVSGNQFTLNRGSTVPYTAKGGVTVSGVMPIYVGQKLYVTTGAASLDLSTLTALNGVNQRVQLDARMILVSGGAMQNAYDFAYANTTLKSRDGSGASTGILGNGTWFASFATSVITFTGASLTAYIEMDLTSWQ